MVDGALVAVGVFAGGSELLLLPHADSPMARTVVVHHIVERCICFIRFSSFIGLSHAADGFPLQN